MGTRREPLPRVFCGEPDDNIAQFAHVTRERIGKPPGQRSVIEFEWLSLRLCGVKSPVMVEKSPFVRVHLAKRRNPKCEY